MRKRLAKKIVQHAWRYDYRQYDHASRLLANKNRLRQEDIKLVGYRCALTRQGVQP